MEEKVKATQLYETVDLTQTYAKSAFDVLKSSSSFKFLLFLFQNL